MRQLHFKIFPFAICFSILFLIGCEKKFDTVIDSAGNTPFLSDAVFSLRMVYSDTMFNNQGLKKLDDLLTIRGFVSTKVLHADGVDKIASVHFFLKENISFTIVKEGQLYDNGILPDKNAFDGFYTQEIDYQFRRVFVGKFTLAVWSIDKFGNLSNVRYLPLEILRRDNQKPILSNLQMDSIVNIGTTTKILQLFITATDLDGQSDITEVYFNSFRPPHGLPSSGNPYFLYNNGDATHGDAIAGDSVYSQTIILPVGTDTGTYRFEFHAVDRSLDSSNVIIKNIMVSN